MYLSPESVYDFEFKSILTSLDYIMWSWKWVSFFCVDNNHIEATAKDENNDWKVDRVSSTPKSLPYMPLVLSIKDLDNYFQHET